MSLNIWICNIFPRLGPLVQVVITVSLELVCVVKEGWCQWAWALLGGNWGDTGKFSGKSGMMSVFERSLWKQGEEGFEEVYIGSKCCLMQWFRWEHKLRHWCVVESLGAFTISMFKPHLTQTQPQSLEAGPRHWPSFINTVLVIPVWGQGCESLT